MPSSDGKIWPKEAETGEAYTSAVSHIDLMPQAVIAHARDLATGDTILPHSHAKAQLIYASSGVMVVTTDTGAFVVPPQYAVWMPAGIVHRINTRGPLAMRTLYVRSDAPRTFPTEVCVLRVSKLLRELVLSAVEFTGGYAKGSAQERMMLVILDQLRLQPTAPLALAMPRENRVRKVAENLPNPADNRRLEDWAQVAGASARTLARLFQSRLECPSGHGANSCACKKLWNCSPRGGP